MNVTLNTVSKSYGNNLILDNINLSIERNSIYCLLGKNGAGKSTLLNMLANIIEPTKGEIIIDELNYRNNELAIKKQLGIQSEFEQIIGELNAVDYLYWIGLLYNMDKSVILKQTENLLKYFFDSDDYLLQPSRNYSSGMCKKLAICAAVLHKPDMLILDEPFANLDPVASDKLCTFINAYRSEKRVIIVSSHDLLYVDKIATHIGVLSNHALVFNGSIDEFKNNGNIAIDEELLKYIQPIAQENSSLDEIV